MCTTIATKAAISGSAKGPRGWFDVAQVYVGYDHPVHVHADHALTLDFVNEDLGPGSRVAVELPREQARRLADRLLEALEAAEAYEGS